MRRGAGVDGGWGAIEVEGGWFFVPVVIYLGLGLCRADDVTEWDTLFGHDGAFDFGDQVKVSTSRRCRLTFEHR